MFDFLDAPVPFIVSFSHFQVVFFVNFMSFYKIFLGLLSFWSTVQHFFSFLIGSFNKTETLLTCLVKFNLQLACYVKSDCHFLFR